jgi:hypothetical protein
MPIVTPSTDFSFLDAVNRILVANGIIRGDTDEVSGFSDLQHGATVKIAKIAVQDELTELVSDTLLPSERDATGSITTVSGTRSYALPSNFIRFFGLPQLYESTSNRAYYEFPGGEEKLAYIHPDYRTAQSSPIYWYIDLTTSKKIGFWYVPSDAKTYTFSYEADPSVENAVDLLPFHNDMESHAFCRLASRRFKFLYEGMDPALLAGDPEHARARSTLAGLMVGKNPPRHWAPVYR